MDTLLDDPNQRSSGGVTMLMSAANTGALAESIRHLAVA